MSSDIFFITIGRPNAQNHFTKTVLEGVPESEYKPYLDVDLHGQVPIWGVEGQSRSRTFWDQIEPGDYLLAYTGIHPMRDSPEKSIEYAAKIRDTEESLEFSKNWWGEYRGRAGRGSEDRGPWPLLIILEEPFEVTIPHTELRDIAGFSEKWNPQNFTSYSGSSKIRQQYGSIGNYLGSKQVTPEAVSSSELVGSNDPSSGVAAESRANSTSETTVDIESLREFAKQDETETVTPTIKQQETREYDRSPKIRDYIKKRSGGYCEGCGEPAPFESKTGEPYLHAHHVDELSRGGSDTIDSLVALCPNCHYRVHHGKDGEEYNEQLRERAWELEHDV